MHAIIILLTAYALLLLFMLHRTVRGWEQTISAWNQTLSELEQIEMENDDLRAELNAVA